MDEDRLETLRQKTRHDQRIVSALTMAMATSTVVLGLLTARLLLHGLQPEPPFTYTANVYSPLEPTCPGGVLRWQSEFTINEAPSTLRIVRTLYDVDRQQVLAFDQNPAWVNWMPEDIGIRQVFKGAYPLPASLAPGHYELRTSAGSTASVVHSYRVPFEIAEQCEKEKP